MIKNKTLTTFYLQITPPIENIKQAGNELGQDFQCQQDFSFGDANPKDFVLDSQVRALLRPLWCCKGDSSHNL